MQSCLRRWQEDHIGISSKCHLIAVLPLYCCIARIALEVDGELDQRARSENVEVGGYRPLPPAIAARGNLSTHGVSVSGVSAALGTIHAMMNGNTCPR
jgi:hypothetical protein